VGQRLGVADMTEKVLGKIAAVQIRGKSHLRSGQPCQDYATGRRRGGVAVVGLADGAGSKTHSEFGARASVHAALRFVLSDFEGLYASSQLDPQAVREALMSKVREAVSLEAAKLGQPVNQLASTLLFAGICAGRYVAGHLGDGSIVLDKRDEPLAILSHPENGEYANTTFFTTDHDAVHRLRLYFGELDDGGIALMSDGTAEALYHRETRLPAPAVRQLLDWHQRLDRRKMEGVLVQNLGGVMCKSSDDLSLALISAK
jgi:hypothetical protein